MRILAILSGVLVAFATLLGITVWLLLQPGFAVEQAKARIAERSGHRLTVATSQVTLLPAPAIVLEDVLLTEPGTSASPLLAARELTIDASLGALLARELDAQTVTIEGAEINLAIDASGTPNWGAAEGEAAVLPDIVLKQAKLAFIDQRSGLTLSLDGFSGTLDAAADGSLAIEGAYLRGSRVGTLGATLTSIQRLGQDGSPLSISFGDNALKFSFDGRLALAKSVGLAGQATLEWPDRMSVSGAFEALGRSLAFKQARIDSLAGGGTGDVTIDLAGRVPRIEAAVDLDGLDLAAFLPPLGVDGGWSERPLGLGRLKQADIAARLNVKDLRLGAIGLGRALLSVTAAAGRMQIAAPEMALHGGLASVGLTIDCTRAIPELALTFAAEKVSLPDGGGEIPLSTITLTSAGHSQAELAGRLAGKAELGLAKGAWRFANLAELVASAGQGIVSEWRPAAAAAKFDTVTATFTIADGIAATNDLRIEAPGIELRGSGEIDVLRHAVDLKAEALGADGKPVFPVPLIFQGSWAAPRLYPDMPGILDDPVAAYKALSKLRLAAETRP